MKKDVDEVRETFDFAYKKLNRAQKEAVDTIEGPVMVVAGPGTGKTQILTLRIANILLKTDTPPSGILALTFTDSGARAMRDRLRQYVGSTAYQIPIYTFHGFAEVLISDYPEAYDKIIGSRPANDLEKIDLLELVLSDSQIKVLRPIGDPSYYVNHILRLIGDLKKENIDPDKLVKIINSQIETLDQTEKIHTKGAHKGKVRSEYSKLEKEISKNTELAYVYRRYQSLLKERKLYDFDDMIIQSVSVLENNEDILRDLQEKYLYILADEHQDVNGAQNRILELLASFHDHPNIFAVGDEKQAIYRFQGASLENFLHFTKKFEGTKVISLTENYRSGQGILDASHSLVEVDEDGPLKELRVPLKADADKSSKVINHLFTHQAVEDNFVCQSIKEEIAEGIPLPEIAVIVRTNREVEMFSELLRKSGIETIASSEGDILRHPIMETVRHLIGAVDIDRNEESLFRVLHGPYWDINTDDLLKVLSNRSYERTIWSIISSDEVMSQIGVVKKSPFGRVSSSINNARARSAYLPPHRVLEAMLQESGLLDYLLGNDPLEGVRVVRRLYDEIESLVLQDRSKNLIDINKILKLRSEYNLPLTAPFISNNQSAVQVMTAHRSKGLEFRSVFIPHLVDSNWSSLNKRRLFNIPIFKTLEKDEVIEDERRLLYVAMTRAKENLFLSSAKTNIEGRETLHSRLLDDIKTGLIDGVDTGQIEKNFIAVEPLKSHREDTRITSELLQSVLSNRGLSATSLNNYLRSPWNYFYRNVLRIPELQPTHMQYGTAMHNTLQSMTRTYTKDKELPNDTIIKKCLEGELNKLPLSVEEYVSLLEKGFGDLMVYKDHLQEVLPFETKEEVSFKVVMKTGLPEFSEVLLTGKLDRVDIDKEGKVVRVVDYKTGKPKTRNEIEGKTKDSDGSYKRQLVFYALLLKLYGDERYNCRETSLSFVQPDGKGKIHEEIFTIKDAEIDELQSIIIETVRQVVSGDFLNGECDSAKSDYCDLVTMFRQNN